MVADEGAIGSKMNRIAVGYLAENPSANNVTLPPIQKSHLTTVLISGYSTASRFYSSDPSIKLTLAKVIAEAGHFVHKIFSG